MLIQGNNNNNDRKKTHTKKRQREKGAIFFLYKNNNHHHDDKYWSARKWDRVRRDRRGRNATRHNHHYCYFIIAIFDFENRLIARLKVDIDHTQTHKRRNERTRTHSNRKAYWNHLFASILICWRFAKIFLASEFIYYASPSIGMRKFTRNTSEGVEWESQSQSQSKMIVHRIHLWQAQIIWFNINFFELMNTRANALKPHRLYWIRALFFDSHTHTRFRYLIHILSFSNEFIYFFFDTTKFRSNIKTQYITLTHSHTILSRWILSMELSTQTC